MSTAVNTKKTAGAGIRHRDFTYYLSKGTSFLWRIVRGVIIIGISYIILYPLFIKVGMSFMREIDIFDRTVQFIPRMLYWENYQVVWEHMKYPVTLRNSLCLTCLVSLLQLGACTLVGYGCARFKFKGSGILFSLVIFTLVVPPQMIMIPLYLNFRYFTFFGLLPEPGINLLGSYWPFIFTAITGMGIKNGLFIYIMRQFFKGMSRELEEAAYIDGAGPVVTFIRVMLPNAVPALITVFLFAFVWQWNDYFYTSIFMHNADVMPIALQELAYNVAESHVITTNYRSIINNTGMLLYIAPLLILYLVLQRYFVESVERTGLVS